MKGWIIRGSLYRIRWVFGPTGREKCPKPRYGLNNRVILRRGSSRLSEMGRGHYFQGIRSDRPGLFKTCAWHQSGWSEQVEMVTLKIWAFVELPSSPLPHSASWLHRRGFALPDLGYLLPSQRECWKWSSVAAKSVDIKRRRSSNKQRFIQIRLSVTSHLEIHVNLQAALIPWLQLLIQWLTHVAIPLCETE